MNASPMMARVYLRVSTDAQDLERQEGIITVAKAAGYYVAGIYREKASGARADRPELETFGENVGILTREVFGLEVVQTGFHRLISDAVQQGGYEQAIARFGGRLGGEARSLARALSMVPPSPPDAAGEGA